MINVISCLEKDNKNSKQHPQNPTVFPLVRTVSREVRRFASTFLFSESNCKSVFICLLACLWYWRSNPGPCLIFQFVPSCFNTYLDQKPLGEETVHFRVELQAGVWGQELKLKCLPLPQLAQLAFRYNLGPPARSGTDHHGWITPASTVNQENAHAGLPWGSH